MNIIKELRWRGLIHQTTKDIEQWLLKPKVIYSGFDPTADSLHIGSLLPLITLRRFQEAGHKVIALVGTTTATIGDPSGKKSQRDKLSIAEVQNNAVKLKNQIKPLLLPNSTLVENSNWFKNMSLCNFISNYGYDFSINTMLSKESIKNRLSTGITLSEFMYQIFQAYDFVHLNREFGCELQIGGSDQWGNIVSGVDLCKKNNKLVYGLTTPLLTNSKGSKMGKTEKGTVWLDGSKTSVYDFYQYWINIPDTEVFNCLRMLTDLSKSEIENVNNPQKTLAENLTKLVHGKEGLYIISNTSKVLFGGSLTGYNSQELSHILQPLNSCKITDLTTPDLVSAMVLTELCSSKSEAHRLIKSNSITLNNKIKANSNLTLTSDLFIEGHLLLKKGKKKHSVVLT